MPPLFEPARSGELQLVERKVVAGAAVNTLSFAGLNGDTDNLYVLYYKILNTLGVTINVKLRPNGLQTNQSHSLHSGSDAGFGGAGAAEMTIATFNRPVIAGRCEFWPVSGIGERLAQAQSVAGDTPAASATVFHQLLSEVWTNSVANVVSLDVVTEDGAGVLVNGFGVGSRVNLFKIPSA